MQNISLKAKAKTVFGQIAAIVSVMPENELDKLPVKEELDELDKLPVKEELDELDKLPIKEELVQLIRNNRFFYEVRRFKQNKFIKPWYFGENIKLAIVLLDTIGTLLHQLPTQGYKYLFIVNNKSYPTKNVALKYGSNPKRLRYYPESDVLLKLIES